jgi:hypothetical protein
MTYIGEPVRRHIDVPRYDPETVPQHWPEPVPDPQQAPAPDPARVPDEPLVPA